MSAPIPKSCAIYTRKSTEEGFEQDFNSLDAQREACSAYILSQAGEGWEAVPEYYDDGGWSGGTMERPALKQLLNDIEAGKIDIVVVYKVDRLTRSLADFAKIVEILDGAGTSFVSVTQAFNTTTSMGGSPLTSSSPLPSSNARSLASGSVTRSRLRRRRGCGWAVPYRMATKVVDRKLLIEPKKADEIRYMFGRYLELRSVPALVEDLAVQGVRTRSRTLRCGKTIGHVPFGRGPLGYLLKNPVYIGKIRHKDKIYDGAHQAIIDPDGRPMSPMRGQKDNKHYCYYVTRFKPGEDRSSICRLPAGHVERIVVDALAKLIKNTAEANGSDYRSMWQLTLENSNTLLEKMRQMSHKELRVILTQYQMRVAVKDESIDIVIVIGEEGLPHQSPPDWFGAAMSSILLFRPVTPATPNPPTPNL